ncbi:MAG: hypothetical protein DSY58_07030 [Desulfobulbus sp.]|nr:MAG: hypothetical protein DSY58_07030 [Desulfobulbus sp.]
MPDKNLCWLVTLLSICCFLFSPAAIAAPMAAPEQQVEKIQNLYRSLTSLSFDFNQLTQNGGRIRKGAGNALFFRPEGHPGVMRWNYTEPDPQVILNDGIKLSIYTKNDNQVIVTSADALQSDITYAFFVGTRNVLDDFTALPAGDRFLFNNSEKNIQAVRLEPKEPHPQIKVLHLWFDSNFYIQKLIMEDHFGSLTELTFSKIKSNTLDINSPETLSSITRLDLPPGTEVISQ